MPRPAFIAAPYGWLALGVLVLTIYGSLIPFQHEPRSFDTTRRIFQDRILSPAEPELLPLWDGANREARGDWILSSVLFLALGYLLMAARCVDRPWWLGLGTALVVWPFCVIVSVLVEFAQIYFEPRTVARIDLVLESLGSLAGVMLWLAVGQRVTEWFRRLGSASGLSGLAARLLPGYLVVLLIVELMPFDFITGKGEVAVKYQEGKIWLMPFHYRPAETSTLLVKTLWNMACFFPLGFLKALAPGRASWANRSAWMVFLMGLGFTTLVECLQLFVYSRFCDTSDIVTGTIAVLLGWWLGMAYQAYWARVSSEVREPWRAGANGQPAAGVGRSAAWAGLFGAWLVVVLFFSWQPFDFTTDPAQFPGTPEETPAVGLARMSWVPLTGYYWGSKYQVFEQLRMKMLSFVPLGVLMVVRLRTLSLQRVRWLTVGAAVIVALGLEIGQCFLPSHGADVTDVLLGVIGAWLGFALTRHIATAFQAERAPVAEMHGIFSTTNGKETRSAALPRTAGTT
jgi:glycopeptide antibiotics resistance protein